MLKNFFAFFGFIFSILLIVFALAVLGRLYQDLGLVSIPDTLERVLVQGAREIKINGTPMSMLGRATTAPRASTPAPDLEIPAQAAQPTLSLPSDIAWEEPTATWIPLPTELPTPVPPLDPAVYRSQTMLRLKDFAAVMQTWMAANDQLGRDNSLQQDPNWRAQMTSTLQHISETARDLDAIGPAPAEFEHIDLQLEQVRVESDSLVADYSRAMDSGSMEDYTQAGNDFTRLKEFLAQAVQEMMSNGWDMQ